MKFLTIRSGIFVRLSDISFVEDQGNGLIRVSTVNASWDVEFPIDALMKMLEADGVRNSSTSPSNNLFGNQHWAG